MNTSIIEDNVQSEKKIELRIDNDNWLCLFIDGSFELRGPNIDVFLKALDRQNISPASLVTADEKSAHMLKQMKQQVTVVRSCFRCSEQKEMSLYEAEQHQVYYCTRCSKLLQDMEKRSVQRSDFYLNEEREQKKAQEKMDRLTKDLFGDDEVKLQGFLLDVSMPSESRLTQKLSKNQLMDLKKLNDSAKVSDITFSLFDNTYSSKIKSIRRDLYSKVIKETCIKIQHIQRKSLYLLPFNNVPQFIQKIELLNLELLELKRNIEIEQERLNTNIKLKSLLEEYSIKIKQVDTTGFKIFYKLNPVKLDAHNLRKILKDDFKHQLNLKGESILAQYEKQLKEQNDQILFELEKEFVNKLKLLLTKLGQKLAGKGYHEQTLSNELQLIENKASSTGLKHLTKLTKTTRTFLEKICENSSESLNACAQDISKLVRIPQADQPEVTIRHGLNKLNDIADSRILSLQRKMEELS